MSVAYLEFRGDLMTSTRSDFHGRLHRGMAKQLVKLLEPLQPFFVEEPLLPGHIAEFKDLIGQTSVPIAVGTDQTGTAGQKRSLTPPTARGKTLHTPGRSAVSRETVSRIQFSLY